MPRPSFPLSRPARLAVFASGRGSNLPSLLAAFPPRIDEASGEELGSVVLVVSNVPGAPVLDKASAAGVPALELAWRGRAAFESAASAALEEHRVDLICLAGFMRVLSAEFTARYQGRLVNIHPSLLPLYPGLAAPQQALEAGAAESGCTVHFVDAGVDTGAKILQRTVAVLASDDATSLAERILAEEQLAYPEAVRMVLTGAASHDGRPAGHPS